MDLDALEKILAKEPKYRLKQAKSAVFRDLIEDWQEAKVLPLELRKALKESCSLGIEAKIFHAENEGTLKAYVALRDGLKIESVLLRHRDARNTVCVSSQVGCPLGCQFCITGSLGFKRNLEHFEIVEQVLFFARLLRKDSFDSVQGKITNVVFMGMGEPLLNYDSVLTAIRILNDKDGFNLGSRHFSISTVGITEGIDGLAQENLQINLAVSLHAPNDELRGKIMPINKKYPIEMILAAVARYIEKTKRRVMFEYIMIRNVNDSDEHAGQLAGLLKNIPLSLVNLVSYNPTGIFKPSSSKRTGRFKEILEKAGIQAIQRYRFGRDIKAACGQLGAFVNEEKIL